MKTVKHTPDSHGDCTICNCNFSDCQECQGKISLSFESAKSPSRQWSKEQESIFTWFKTGKGNLIIRARAGTGKTSTLIQAFRFAPEGTILYAVFNKKNAVEAEGKINDPRLTVKTLHALGYSFILKNWKGVRPDYKIEQERIKQIIGQDVKWQILAEIAKLVSFLKNGFINPTLAEAIKECDLRGVEVSGEGAKEYTTEKIAEIALQSMELAKSPNRARMISFDDMVWLPVAMAWVTPCFDLVCVDEAQDMSLPQLTMAISACRKGGRICLVGDDRQAIYGFRGAYQNGLDKFKVELSASELPLTLTFRCPKSVVELAREFVPDYEAFHANEQGTVENMVEEKALDSAIAGDAILSRLNAPLMRVCLQLLRSGKTARIEGKDIGKKLCTLLKNLGCKNDLSDFADKLTTYQNAMLARYTNPQKIDLLNDECATLLALSEDCLNLSAMDGKIKSIFVDSDENPRPSIVLSSVHKAKGLEWNKVFLIRSSFRPGKGGEEINIYYVALTRAKKQLVFID